MHQTGIIGNKKAALFDQCHGLFQIGFTDQAFEEDVDHSDRTLDRVEREYKIEVEKYVVTTTATIEIKRGN